MSARDRLQPRRRPVQARAVETRDQILEAAARVFEEHGYAAGTTNRIAEAAHLSIGTVYEYFPNKDAIVAELARLHALDSMGTTERVLADLPDTFEGRVRALVDAAIASHDGGQRLHRVLFEEAPAGPSGVARDHREGEERLARVVATLIADDPTLRVRDPLLAARVVVVTVDALVNRLLAHDPPIVEPDVLADEAVALVTGYLRGAAAPEAG